MRDISPLCESLSSNDGRRHLEAIVAHHRQLEMWARHCPENFANRAALVGAEIALMRGAPGNKNAQSKKLPQISEQQATPKQYQCSSNMAIPLSDSQILPNSRRQKGTRRASPPAPSDGRYAAMYRFNWLA